MRPNALVLLLVAVCAFGLTYAQQAAPQWWDLTGIGTTAPSPRTDPAIAPFPPGDVVLFEGGRTLPLKFELTCGGQLLTSAEVAAPRLVAVTPFSGLVSGTPATIPPTVTSDTGGLFRLRNTKWVYNLSTKELALGSYELLIEMPDGLRYSTTIALR